MSEPTDHPGESTPVGQLIDALVAEIPKLSTQVDRAASALEHAERERRNAHDALIVLVGRPAAAKLLGITPRQLAGRLRGPK